MNLPNIMFAGASNWLDTVILFAIWFVLARANDKGVWEGSAMAPGATLYRAASWPQQGSAEALGVTL